MKANPKIEIHVSGSIDNYNGGRSFLNSIKENYESQYHGQEWSNATGEPEPLLFSFRIYEMALNFIGLYIAKKAGEWIVKETILKPFFEKLEQLEDINEDLGVGHFEFQFDDIVVRIGYSRKNHINVVSYISIELLKRIPFLRSLNLGKLNLIATPVVSFDSSWQFWENPSSSIPFSDFIVDWGIEYNGMNRLVYHLHANRITYQNWWG